MTQAETAAQAELEQIAKELEALRRRLMKLHGSLTPAPLEMVMLAGEEELDVTTEIRTIIECVVQDSIQPAIRDLEAAAAYQTEQAEKKEK